MVAVIVSALFGLAAGVLSGFLGIGGGAILTPLLAFTLGIEQHRAQGISLAALLPPIGLPAVLTYRRSGVRIDFRLVLLLVVGFGLGGVAGAWFAHRIPSQILRWLFAAFLLVSAWRAISGASDDTSPNVREPPALLGIAIGLAAGMLSGLLGVGGGLVALPLLRRFGGLGRLEAQATTLAMMLPPIGLPAVYVYAKEQGGLPWVLLLAVATGFAVGAGSGARLATKAHAQSATRVYAAFLACVAVLLLIRA